MLIDIIDKINKENLNHKDTIIIGDNSIGKSELLKLLAKEDFEKYYIIDSVNRNLNTFNIIANENIVYDYKSINETRIKEDNFNLRDSFNFFANESIDSIIINYFDELKVIVKEFLDVDIEIEELNYGFQIQNKLIINNEIDKISSGYQAIMRIFLELIYLKKCLEEKKIESITVIIDEVDKYLSSKNKSKIIVFLKQRFKYFNFIITTHSSEVISSCIDFNLIILKEDGYEVLDSNDFNTITDVQEIFEKLYNIVSDKNDDYIETILRRLLNSKINNLWGELEKIDLEKIKGKKLSNSQKLLLHQIENW